MRLLAACFALCATAPAATFTVTSTAATGTGSLSQAVANAAGSAGADTINFAVGFNGVSIHLNNTLVLDQDLTIDASSLSDGLTVSGNNASRIFIIGAGRAVTLVGLTLTDGRATNDHGGGGLFFYVHNAAPNNCIIAANTAPNGPDLRNYASTLSATGANLIGDFSASGLAVGPAVITGAPLLAPLGNYGGPAQSMPPEPTSPAIDAGGATTLSTDQRGLPRPLGLAPDIGAVELAPFTQVPIKENLMAASDQVPAKCRFPRPPNPGGPNPPPKFLPPAGPRFFL